MHALFCGIPGFDFLALMCDEQRRADPETVEDRA
jgi:hypothetical protein